VKCDDETADCSTKPRCANISKMINGHSVPNADVDPNCAVTVLDHFTSSFTWATNNFAAIWLRPQWYLVTNSVITDVQNGGLTFVSGGDYTKASAINGLWTLADKNVFVGNTQTGNPFAENDGPFNPNGGLECDKQDVNFCLSLSQQMMLDFENWSVNQRLFSIYDGPSAQANNAYLDIKPTILDKCNADDPNVDAGCLHNNYPIAYGPVNGIMRDKTKGTKGRCFLPNAAIGWKQPNGFYYPPAFHSSNLFFSNVDIRHFVTEPDFTGPGFKTNDTAAFDTYCFAPGKLGAFTGFSDIDRQTVLNDDDGSLTGLLGHGAPLTEGTLSINKLSPFFKAPYQVAECASQTGVTATTPAPPAPQPTADTSPYEYLTTVVLPQCTQVDKPLGQENARCGCDTGGNNCTEWSQECTNGDCPGVRLYRQLKTSASETASFIRMAGQKTWQRSTLTANNGLYYVDTTYTEADQVADGFAASGPLKRVNNFRSGQDYYVFFVYAQGTTKQKYQMYVGGSTAYKPNTCKPAGAPVPFAIRADIAVKPSKITKQNSLPSGWDYCYDDKGVVTVTVDLTSFSAELSPKPSPNFNALCQPKTFCSPKGVTNDCACNLKASDPMVVANPDLLNECKNACTNWAAKDLDCPIGGCIGFGVTLPGGFDPAAGKAARPALACFPKTSAWKFGTGFVGVSSSVAGTQCTYASLPAGNFCP
jgi:hypothetical protein